MNRFKFFSKKAAAQRFQPQESPQLPPLQTFILEPILTPSGLLDGGDSAPDPMVMDWGTDAIADADIPDTDGMDAIADADIPDTDGMDAIADIDIPDDDIEPVDFFYGDADDPLGAISDPSPIFESGVFTVGETGEVSIDFLFDGGQYQGELAVFSLDGMDEFEPGSQEFIQEAASRALSNSELGHVALSDTAEGAKFNGALPHESNFNTGEYQGVKTFSMRPGDTFGVMLVPHGTVQQLFDNPAAEGYARPLFSMTTSNPNDAFHMGQIADVTGDGNTFVMEDMRVDGWTDKDYNDVVFQVRGATAEAVHLDDVIDSGKDWRSTDMGQALIAYAEPYVTPDADDGGAIAVDTIPDLEDSGDDGGAIAVDPILDLEDTGDDGGAIAVDTIPDFEDIAENPANDTEVVEEHTHVGEVPVTNMVQPQRFEFAKANQPLVGVIDTGFSANNPDIDYSRIILGQDRVAGDANPLLSAGEGNEHGTHVLGIIGATQDNGIGINGVNDEAPIWVGRATGSGQWSQSLIEFVDAAKESQQPNAVVNLSFDLTQINPDGSITTRTELTAAERGALEYARHNNVLVVVSAGNQGGEMSALGTASLEFDNVIAVGAVGSDSSAHADYSSFGAGLDVMALGGDADNPIVSTKADGIGTGFGTSVATARVTGAASQVWAANPDLSYHQIKDILKATATDLAQIGWDAGTGAGLLNMNLAVQLAASTTPKPKLTQSSTINLPDLKTPVLGSTQAENGVVYVSTSFGQILRINTETGEQSQVFQGRAFTDLAVAPSGKLYGSTFNGLFEINSATGEETFIGQFASRLSINALTFSPDGKLYGADSETGKLFLISPQTAQAVEMGSLGGPSSGDIIFNGRNQILATVKGSTSDRLVAVDVTTGNAKMIGDLGFSNIYGLALLNGALTALTAEGQKLAINPRTGVATLQGTVSSQGQIWGAADNPSSAGIVTGELPTVLPEGQVDPNRLPVNVERETDAASQSKASAMGSDWRTEYDRTQNWIGSITSLQPRFFWRDGQGRNWEIINTTNGYIIRTPGLGAFAFSWEEYNNTKSWDLFWNAVHAGLTRNQIIALKNAYWDRRNVGTQIVGSLQRWGNGWTQEFRDGSGNRTKLMLEDGANTAYWMQGGNLAEYEFVGGPVGRNLEGRWVQLGYPRSNENQISRSDGKWAVWQAFSGNDGKARIHYLDGIGSVATWGSIGSLYTNLGGTYHWLGMPTRREYIDGDTIFADFQGGRIAYNRNDGRTEAIHWGEQPSWRRPVGNPDIDIQVDFYGNFTLLQRNLIQQAVINWENIITRDKVSSGVLRIAITQGSKTMNGGTWGHWAETTFMENQQKSRLDLTRDYLGEGRIHFNSQIINTLSSNSLVRLTMHEIGHALGLDEAQFDATLGMNSVMDLKGLDPNITEGMYKRLEWLGYSVNRSSSINWG
ncbi:S8 family serine peptidase [Coleofasciculus sp. H7-2]|uniref:S8 family serine peptidase n=1 Tax=Coleofasciculus sp. H7-2 TaxID=3351545 RepID=UPI00366FBF58